MAKDEAYRRAEKKIEDARRSGATELDLRGMGLRKLPESLGRLVKLQVLDLSFNELTALPEWLGQLTRLVSLDLSCNQLTALPEGLGRLTQLQLLRLWQNELTALPESLGQLTQLESLNLSRNKLTALPESLGLLRKIKSLDLFCNKLTALPESLGRLTKLRTLCPNKNRLKALPESLGRLTRLESLVLSGNNLKKLPPNFEDLRQLKTIILGDISNGGNPLCVLPEFVTRIAGLSELGLRDCKLTDLPSGFTRLVHLKTLDLDKNPLNPELAAAYAEGLDAVKRYLRAKAEEQVVLNEAKLILIGEGEVGKSCLLGALRGDEWVEDRDTTHGIEIKPVLVTDPKTGTQITLNGWDFGGQRVYRPTHQLFFSSPAVYLVVWKPRVGPQAGAVKEWIKLVKHREPDSKILVVATHGGPKERQPDIDRQEIWDLFDRNTVIEFSLVESKPDEDTQERKGIDDLKQAIARVAAELPEMGREVPKRWNDARTALKETGSAYLPLDRVKEICYEHGVEKEASKDFVRICHRLGHLIHYEHDPILRDIVVLKPDWLSTAISFVLDDRETRDAHGLVSFAGLSELWNDPERPEGNRYPAELHPVFLRLMERFDLSYRIAEPCKDETQRASLVAQLVPDVRPEKDLSRVWPSDPTNGDGQQMQICEIVEIKNGQSATAEGLFYQLIVRLHKYSLGRVNYRDSVHWQRGLVVDDDYNGRALLENIGNDVRITVRAPYPERFLSVLTSEVKWLVESFWTGLRCDVMVPCIEPCGKKAPGTGLYEVQKLIESKRRDRPEYPCPVCNEWQDIDNLLRNAPAARRMALEDLLDGFSEMKVELAGARQQLIEFRGEAMGRFDRLDIGTQRILSKVDDAFDDLMRALTADAKEGPRLFSFEPVDPGFLDRPKWISEKFRLTLWCEHSRLPLTALNEKADKSGVYDLTLPRKWFVKAAPFLKILTTTLSLVVPVASSATKLVMDEAAYKGIEKQLDLGQKSIDSVFKGGEKAGDWLGRMDAPDLEQGESIGARGGALRELQSWLKEKDPSFGGLVRVQNKRHEFLWVHPRFEGEY
jgi:Leucine-rich repeat (LRR) protein/GTPase SAR1 family protein